MRRQQIEAKVLSIYDSIKSGNNVEDSYIELKADWPQDHAKAARRIAAHANAARGEDILWIIGLDEDRGVQTIQPSNMADWWPQVKRYFDSPVPNVTDLVVKTDDGVLVALHFETDSAPYVVKNPVFGQPGGGPVEREVPWRIGTRVRSATREDLIRLLVPVQRLPHIEILEASISANKSTRKNNEDIRWIWEATFTFYVTPRSDNRIVFPNHRTSITLLVTCASEKEISMSEVAFLPPDWWITDREKPSSATTVVFTKSEAIITNPGKLLLGGSYSEPYQELIDVGNVIAKVNIKPAGEERTITIEQELQLGKAEKGRIYSWKLPV